ncbi:MAG: YcxB family protein [Lachnospiraceae bacterium]|nr:YcxB family protein [Lachnospiraceae bacterium]
MKIEQTMTCSDEVSDELAAVYMRSGRILIARVIFGVIGLAYLYSAIYGLIKHNGERNILFLVCAIVLLLIVLVLYPIRIRKKVRSVNASANGKSVKYVLDDTGVYAYSDTEQLSYEWSACKKIYKNSRSIVASMNDNRVLILKRSALTGDEITWLLSHNK